ncbi:hypothetical protein DKL61_01015 [Gammaproteobacteria bacterium ESL0073]|nr:hypothetical protein DKL61_01015 [Gammaproteobacteria bacterium ESL0073]
MKQIKQMGCLFFILITLIACSDKSDDTEKNKDIAVAQIVQQYYADIATGRLESAKQMISQENAQAEEMETYMLRIINNEMKKRGGYESIDIASIKYTNENEANVEAFINMKTDIKSENIMLIKEHEQWKIKPHP